MIITITITIVIVTVIIFREIITSKPDNKERTLILDVFLVPGLSGKQIMDRK